MRRLRTDYDRTKWRSATRLRSCLSVNDIRLKACAGGTLSKKVLNNRDKLLSYSRWSSFRRVDTCMGSGSSSNRSSSTTPYNRCTPSTKLWSHSKYLWRSAYSEPHSDHCGERRQIDRDSLSPEVGKAISVLRRDAGVQQILQHSREYQLKNSAK